MRELARCQCATFGRDPDFGCTAVATQEDLLCDTCRSGCNGGMTGTPHLKIIDFTWTARGPVSNPG